MNAIPLEAGERIYACCYSAFVHGDMRIFLVELVAALRDVCHYLGDSCTKVDKRNLMIAILKELVCTFQEKVRQLQLLQERLRVNEQKLRALPDI